MVIPQRRAGDGALWCPNKTCFIVFGLFSVITSRLYSFCALLCVKKQCKVKPRRVHQLQRSGQWFWCKSVYYIQSGSMSFGNFHIINYSSNQCCEGRINSTALLPRSLAQESHHFCVGGDSDSSD